MTETDSTIAHLISSVGDDLKVDGLKIMTIYYKSWLRNTHLEPYDSFEHNVYCKTGYARKFYTFLNWIILSGFNPKFQNNDAQI